jgi:hypothetical protein
VRAPSPDLTPEQQEVLADVAEQGVHVVHVPRDGGQGPSYSYTVGLWESFQQPEVVVFGMPEDVAQDLLDAVADDASEGRTVQAGDRRDDLLVGYPVRFFPVPADVVASHLGRAVRGRATGLAGQAGPLAVGAGRARRLRRSPAGAGADVGMTPAPQARPAAMAAAWFLAFCALAVVVFAWSRGMGRVLLPLLAIGGVALVLSRLVKALRAPVD